MRGETFTSIGEDIVGDSEVVADKVLEENADARAQFVGAETADVDAVEEDLSLLRIVKAKEKFYQGGFAEAVAAVDACDLAAAGAEGEVREDVAVHVGVAEGDVTEFDFEDVGRHVDGFGWGEDGGLEGEKFEEIADEETVVVESGDGSNEGSEITLSATEGLEEHDEGADGDGTGKGLSGEKPHDGEHSRGFDEGAENVEHPQPTGNGQQLG